MVEEHTTTGEGGQPWLIKAQKQLIGFVLILAVATVAYRVVYGSEEKQTAALYWGIPSILAICLALFPRNKSVTGMLLKGSTLAMLIPATALPLGMLWLLYVLPQVALIAVLVGVPIDVARRRNDGRGLRSWPSPFRSRCSAWKA